MASGWIHSDGFDDQPDMTNGTDKKWNVSGGVNQLGSAYALNGQGKGALLFGGNTLKQSFGVNVDHVVVGLRMKVSSFSENLNYIIFYCNNGLSDQLIINRTNIGTFQVFRGGTKIGETPVFRMLGNVTYYAQFRVKFDDSVGVVEIVVDGEQLLNLTSVDTQNNGATEADCDAVAITNGGGNTTVTVDDVFIYDYAIAGSLHGDRKVIGCFPSGAGNYTQWTPSAGSNFQCVDEVGANGDTDYVSSSTVGQKDSYPVTSHGITTGSVTTVVSNIEARKDDGATRQIRDFLRHSTTDTNGTTRTLSTTYERWVRAYDDVPGGSGWTLAQAGASAVQVGVEVIT